MFKRSKEKVINLIINYLKNNPELIENIVINSDNVISNTKKLITNELNNEELIKSIGINVEKANTKRFVEEYDIKIRELEEEERKMYNSSEPWVNVFSRGHDIERGIELKIFWNPAFIKYLKDHGIEGDTEEAAVQDWLAMLNIDILINDV
jgi:hypothetical protein